MECGRAPRKGKKKQVKDELDRIKQAEKKKRRLEKALATSAAIISELEKKKQKKKEEQQRLDEEGAAIAEAVALQVLIGEEESDDTYGMTQTAAIMPHETRQQCRRSSNDEVEWVWNAHGGSRCVWSDVGAPCVDEGGWEAVQAVSSLQIADDGDMNAFVYNRMVRG